MDPLWISCELSCNGRKGERTEDDSCTRSEISRANRTCASLIFSVSLNKLFASGASVRWAATKQIKRGVTRACQDVTLADKRQRRRRRDKWTLWDKDQSELRFPPPAHLFELQQANHCAYYSSNVNVSESRTVPPIYTAWPIRVHHWPRLGCRTFFWYHNKIINFAVVYFHTTAWHPRSRSS